MSNVGLMSAFITSCNTHEKKKFSFLLVDSLQFVSHIKKHQNESLVIGRSEKLVQSTKDFNASKSDENIFFSYDE